VRLTATARALEILQTKTLPVDLPTLMIGMPSNTYWSTVSRALRRMRSKGIVSSQRNGGRWVFWSFNSSQTAKVPLSKQQPKGAVRRNVMCRPDNMPTLCEAIDSTVKMLVGTKTEFSAFDITKDLRSQVSDGAVTIDTAETGTVHVGGKDVAKIDHEIIRDAVHDIFKRGEMSGYSRFFTGSHWTYSKAPDDPPPPDDSDDDSDDSDDDDGATGTAYDGSSSL